MAERLMSTKLARDPSVATTAVEGAAVEATVAVVVNAASLAGNIKIDPGVWVSKKGRGFVPGLALFVRPTGGRGETRGGEKGKRRRRGDPEPRASIISISL